MDMNFPHRTEGLAPRPVSMLGDMEPDLHILLAMASAQQAASPTARCIAADMGAPAEADFVDALSRVFAARRLDKVKAKSLAGCFNPLIAGHLGSGTVPDGNGN
jgi:hypothetical protein